MRGFFFARPHKWMVGVAAIIVAAALLDQAPVLFAQTKPGKSAITNINTQEKLKERSQLESKRVRPTQSATVNLRSASKSKKRISPTIETQVMPAPGSIKEVQSSTGPAARLIQVSPDTVGPLLPSPAPSSNFQGEFDEAANGTGTFFIPPDTMGAVGLNRVVSYLNNNIVVQDKAAGTFLSVTAITTFWSATGASGVFDPRIQYDPYNNRWIVAAVSNAQTANSSVLVGISNTSDPQGTYSLFRVVVGCSGGSPGCNAQGEWADFPMLGFNKNWITVAWNQFTTGGTFISGHFLVVDYPFLRGGSFAATQFSGLTAGQAGFCAHPATTLSPTEETLYIPSHLSSLGATYRLHKITGTPASPNFVVGASSLVRPGGAWRQPSGDILPQHCIPGVGASTQTCPASLRFIDVGDAFIRSNVVFRNGKIYYAQTIGLPDTGLTHTAAQWTALNTDGTVFDGGRVEDPTATDSNGGSWYAYPSLSVNKNNDVLLGFSEFESDDYVDAGYTLRLGTDPAGTMRDPVIYKEGEDYYQKTFSGSRNRWGDYSHTVVDPVNDRDLWTIQEYARSRVGTTGEGANDSRWGTWWAKLSAPAGPGDLIISEFRLRGPAGANDEFVEIYNPNTSPLTVNTVDGSSGYSLVASDGTARFTIPNGTVIPAKGHFLGINSSAYSLSNHPAGNGTASGDATYTTDIPDNAGIALFNSSIPASYTLSNRIDAVGSASEGNPLYKEGAGYPALTPFSIEYSFLRSFCPGNTPIFGTALGCAPGVGGIPRDTNNNAADFIFVDTNHTSAGAGQRLGAPGPENLSSPLERNSGFPILLLDATSAQTSSPNRVRDFTSDAANNSTFGTLSFRRRIANTTSQPATRLRFRAIDLTTFPAPGSFADLRLRSSGAIVVSGINDTGTCSPQPTPCSVTVQGTTLDQPPAQLLGGGFNTAMSAGTVTLATPLPPGASVNVQFLVGIEQTGSFRFFIIVEALP